MQSIHTFSIQDIVLWLVTVNAFTWLLFWLDKRRARNDGWRIPEHVLLGAALLGGSPGAYLAMRRFRHKTRKSSFRVRYWLVVALQALGVGYILLS